MGALSCTPIVTKFKKIIKGGLGLIDLHEGRLKLIHGSKHSGGKSSQPQREMSSSGGQHTTIDSLNISVVLTSRGGNKGGDSMHRNVTKS